MRRAWLVLLAAPAACLFPDVGSLEGDAASEASSPDVVVEAAPLEASAEAGDAGNDAGPEAGYCASLGGTHALCEDFDETTAFSAQFTSVNLSTNGSLANDTTIVVTPPRSLLSSIPAEGTKTGDDAHMKRLFAGSGSKATYAFDFRVDSLPTSTSGVFATIIVDDGLPARHNLSIYLTDTYAAVEESYSEADGGYVYKDHPLTVAIPIGKWVRVTFSLDTTARTCNVSIDGTPALVSAVMDSSWKAAGAITMDIGLGYVGSETTAWQARYDDVVFDFQ